MGISRLLSLKFDYTVASIFRRTRAPENMKEFPIEFHIASPCRAHE
jgi:hypothetical protein